MIKEDFCYPKEEMDKLIVKNDTIQAAIWTDNYSPSVCYDFYTEPAKKYDESDEDRLYYKCARIRIKDTEYKTIVSAIINVEYPLDEAQALINNYAQVIKSVTEVSEEKITEYTNEWKAFQELREKAKAIGKLLTNTTEE